jgi:2-polyprenyl-3-methyl-5-hydroxy-6-metoxy-1,4-benzoquinol methylase
MQQTPVHDNHNPDLLKLIPVSSNKLIEVGCSSGALAREFKKINPKCHYSGVDIDSTYAELAKRYCDVTLAQDMDTADQEFYQSNADRDCWIFGDTLEHMRDPWAVLRKIRAVIPANGAVVTCIPNAQHWSMFAKLSIGDFRYEDSGLFDRTHLRWFTRETLFELFSSTGFQIVEGISRNFPEPNKEKFLPLIGSIAKAMGRDYQTAVADASPLQYVVKAIPV